MDKVQLTNYIFNYLENDKTNTAIMLTGAWGSGKSYYIKNELKEELEKKGKSYVLISLYGINTIEDISKALYLEIRAKKIKSSSEKAVAGKLVAKTIVNGVASFFGVNISPTENDLQKLYESIDLSGKLIIFEDFERCPINQIELLGYINNLVEQDGVKVLIVANEEQIIKREEYQCKTQKEEDGRNFMDKYSKEKMCYTRETKEYLQKKEKTISDTITYNNDYKEAIFNIISKFKNPYFDELLLDKNSNLIDEIQYLMIDINCYNLRSFTFACQKIHDIFNEREEC